MLRRTKIIATIGPACESEHILKAVIREGVDVIRINTSHITSQKLPYWTRLIRKVSSGLKKNVAILVDLQGPRIRTGRLRDGKPVLLKRGELISIVVSSNPGFSNGDVQITTSCREFPKMVKRNDPIYLDNGLIDLRVVRTGKNRIWCRVIAGEILGENKGINLPNAPITLPAMSENDRRILKIAAEQDVDYIALSFVRSANDILSVKQALKRYGKKIPVIAKIEKPRAVERIDSIIEVSDGIMVARGDLGIELGVEKIPAIQKELIEKANQKNIGVITATQMLESMMEHARPSRAEASDIANAVFDDTDAVMLSGETAVGKHPVESVQMMNKIVLEAEKNSQFKAHYPRTALKRKDHPLCAITHAAQDAASELEAKAIVSFTRNGDAAILVSKFERSLPVVALTPSLKVNRRLSLFQGIFPIKVDYCKGTDKMFLRAEKAILSSKLLKKGDAVVVVSGKYGLEGANYMVKIHWIGK